MGYIYAPKGKAAEYAALALNLYDGCEHECKYCYVPAVLRRTREAMACAKPRNIDWAKLEREISALPEKSEVFLSFTSDPYQPIDARYRLARKAISMLHDAGKSVRILTKAGIQSMCDFDLLATNPGLSSYGVTLTFTSPKDEAEWEPAADNYIGRLDALQRAYELGIPTWASLEPVIDPEQSLELIQMSAPFTDKFKIGKWNYDARANEIDWTAFLRSAIDLLQNLGKAHYIKLETRPFLPKHYPPESKGR